MSRWERLFYYLKIQDRDSSITIHHLVAPTPHLREMVLRSPTHASGDLSHILPETPTLKFLEISLNGIGPLPPSLGQSVAIASVQSSNVQAWINTLSQLEGIHTLILKPPHFLDLLSVLRPSLKLPSVQTLILVGPLDSLPSRLECLEFPALQTLEIDLSTFPFGVAKQWSKWSKWSRAAMGEQLKRILNAGVQKLVLKSIWFDRWEDIVDILQDAKGRVRELVCIDILFPLRSDKELKAKIDLCATLMQQGAVCPAAALSMLDSLHERHDVERSEST